MSNVEVLDFAQMNNSNKQIKPLLDQGNLEIVKNVKVRLEVRVGEAELTIDELINLGKDSVVSLTCSAMAPVDLLLDGKIVARGHLVAADDNFGIQITELGL